MRYDGGDTQGTPGKRRSRHTRRTRRNIALTLAALAACSMVSVPRGGTPINPGPLAPGRVEALAPNTSLCSSKSSFCGAVLRIDSSTGTIGSVAAGAHYGAAWGIPPTPNDSTGIGWCVDDTHTGFPVGPISEQPLPTVWTAYDHRLASTIISLYGGDNVLPYQPLEIDATGEIVGETVTGTSPTRLRHVAVWLALRSVLVDPAGTPRIDLVTAKAFSDRAGRRPSPTGTAAIPLARRMVEVARRVTPQRGDAKPTVQLTADQRAADPGDLIRIPVRVTDGAGRPVAHVPVWPHRSTNAAITPHPSGDRASRQVEKNAVLAGWPSFDTTRNRSGATVTNMDGVAFFDLRVRKSGVWSASFTAETSPTGLLLFGDDINAQNNVTLRGGTGTRAATSVEGETVPPPVTTTTAPPTTTSTTTTTNPPPTTTTVPTTAPPTTAAPVTTAVATTTTAPTTSAPPTTLPAPTTIPPPTTTAVTTVPPPTTTAPPTTAPPTTAPPTTLSFTATPPSTMAATTTTTTTTPPPSTSTTVPAPPSTAPPTPAPPSTAPPPTSPPTSAPAPTEPSPERFLPRTGGAAWQTWFRAGTWIVLAGAAVFFASTIGLGPALGRARRPDPSTAGSKRKHS